MDGTLPPKLEQAAGQLTFRRLAGSLALLALLVLLWGGYDRHWHWTGFAHNATLWDWLHIFMLPLALTAAPLWLRHRAALDRTRQLLLALAVAGFVVLVALGYGLDLGWTGFPGNRLWDWLELLVLPLAVALLPVWSDISRSLRLRHIVGAGCASTALAVTAVGGYEYGWRWTGFQGNTLFDWLQLFVAPLLLPIVLVPLIRQWMVADVAEPERAAPGAPQNRDPTAGGASRAASHEGEQDAQGSPDPGGEIADRDDSRVDPV